MLRFHSPLIEPDVRISRIRLSDKDSRVRPREARPRSPLEPDQAQRRRAGSGPGSVTAPTPAPCASAPATDGAYGKRVLSPLR